MILKMIHNVCSFWSPYIYLPTHVACDSIAHFSIQIHVDVRILPI